MANYNALEALINAYIKQNGVKAITGQVLNGVLRGMVSALGKGWTIAEGDARPDTDPGTMTGPVAYVAHTAGTYTNFGGLVVNEGEVALLKYNEQTWTKEVLASLAANATIDCNVGTPAVGVSFHNGVLTFDFRNMKGNPGDSAGFGTVNATVDGTIGTPGVSVQSSGPDTAKNFTFAFTGLKGETGVTSVVASVDNTTGTPSCSVSLVGQELHLDFTGLKGAQGDTGVSADYPIAIVNNLTTDDPASALSAAQGVVLAGQVSQLEHKVDGIFPKTGNSYTLQVPAISGSSISNSVKYPLVLEPGKVKVKMTDPDGVLSDESVAVYKYVNGVRSYWKDAIDGIEAEVTISDEIDGVAFWKASSGVVASGNLIVEIKQEGILDTEIQNTKTIAERKIERLAWIGPDSSGHTWVVGEKIYNTTSKKLAVCIAASPNQSFGPNYTPSEESAYIYGNDVYLWDGSNMSRASERDVEMLRLVMDGKYTFDAYLFQKGKLYLGNVVADDYSIATTNKQVAKNTLLLYAKAGYRFYVQMFDDNGSYYLNSGWVTEYRIEEGETYRLCISTTSGTSLANIPEFVSGLFYRQESIDDFVNLPIYGRISKTFSGIASTSKSVISKHNAEVIPVKISKGEAFDISRTGVLTEIAYYAIKADDTRVSLSKQTGEQYYIAPFDIVAIGYYYASSAIPTSGEYTITVTSVSLEQIKESAIGIGAMDYYGAKIQPIDMFTTKRLCRQEVLLSETMVEGGLQEAWGSGMVVTNGKVFSFNDGATCSIFDLSTMELIEHASLPWSAHNNNAQPTPYYYDEDDAFPIFLVSYGDYPGSGEKKFIFVRVVETNGSFEFTVVKEVSYDFPGADYNASWFANYEKGELYCYTYPNGIWSVRENNPITIHKFRFPSLDNYGPVVLTTQDIIGTIELRDHWIMQSGLFHDGKIFLQVQAYNDWEGMTINGEPYDLSKGRNFIFVIDESGYIETIIPLRAFIEPEGLCIYDGALYSSAKYSTAAVGQLCFLLTKYTF